jgi:hypothetical protein
MDRIAGVSFKYFQEISTTRANAIEFRARLCVGFAAFMSRAWHHKGTKEVSLGRVGSSIVPRLQSLNIDLPLRFRPVAKRILEQMPLIEAIPWVFTHGDIIAGNILVNPSSGQLLGFVDWAEAENLPFGTCLYGLEEVLGEMTATGFQYHANAADLRDIFWSELKKCIPDLQKAIVLETVNLARDLGVLLWYGIAFDNGAINRVVQEGKDVDEIRRLDAFLDLTETESTQKL